MDDNKSLNPQSINSQQPNPQSFASPSSNLTSTSGHPSALQASTYPSNINSAPVVPSFNTSLNSSPTNTPSLRPMISRTSKKLSLIAFRLTLFPAIFLGPVLAYSINALSPYAWIVGMMFPYVLIFAIFASFIAAILILISAFRITADSKPNKKAAAPSKRLSLPPRAELSRILTLNICSMIFIITIGITSLLSIVSVTSTVILYSSEVIFALLFIIIQYIRTKRHSTNTEYQQLAPKIGVIRTLKILSIITLICTIITSGVYIARQIYQASLTPEERTANTITQLYERYAKQEQEDSKYFQGAEKISSTLASAAYRTCYSQQHDKSTKFSLIKLNPIYPEEAGIFKCDVDNGGIFYLRNAGDKPHRGDPTSPYANVSDKLLYRYEFGTTNDSKIEQLFGNIPSFSEYNEAYLALSAESEADLINKYSDRLYELLTNSSFNEYTLAVYYADSFSDIKTAYDQLFLRFDNKYYESNGVNGYNQYYFYPADLTEVFSEIPLSSFPQSAQSAVSANRHIMLKIEWQDFSSMRKASFKKLLENSFVDPITEPYIPTKSETNI